MKINHGKKTISVKAKKLSELGKFIGLMFKSKNTENLLFEFKNKRLISIHSLFVFFHFLAIWLDDKDNIVEYRIIKPFSFIIKPKNPAKKLIEIPFNSKNKKILKIFVEKGKI
ncbi:DUF192 domain-containing protein [Candidatus Pacearchaeota archaeon]|nr:DUF192 domain-containing protein [Candidatus Pacearchaeota archaeon]